MFDDAPGAAPHGSSSGIHRGAIVLLGGGLGVPVFEGSEYRNNKSLRAAHTYSRAPSKSINTPKQANIHTRVVYITARSLGQVDAYSFLLVTRRRRRYACLVLFVLLLLFPLFVVLTVTDSCPRSGSPQSRKLPVLTILRRGGGFSRFGRCSWRPLHSALAGKGQCRRRLGRCLTNHLGGPEL